MFAVSISLGSTSAYVSEAPVSQPQSGVSVSAAAPIRVVANSAGHRHTPVAAALTEQEILFGENAIHSFVRHPQKVVPYLFSYSAAAAASSDAAQVKDSTALKLAGMFLEAVERGSRVKYGGHCQLETREVGEGIQRHGFAYEADDGNGESVERFASAEDLFIQFLNYIKEHSIDGVCGLSGSEGDAASSGKDSKKARNKNILLTVVVPRAAFPGVAAAAAGHSPSGCVKTTAAARRADAVDWLSDAVQASQLGDVVLQTAILFSDEAALLAFDSAPRAGEPTPRPYFLLPPSAATFAPAVDTSVQAAEEAVVLVVDWGAQALCFSLLKTSAGLLTQPKGGVPYMCCTSGSDTTDSEDGTTAHYYVGRSGTGKLVTGGGGGDTIDVSLADKVAASYIVANRRTFQSLVPNTRPLQELLSGNGGGPAASEAKRIVAETIPSRAMRKLRLLMGEKKIALNTNPQASSVAVEMEAFYDGMDLLDNQSLSRNKFESAVVSEWLCIEHFETALAQFVQRHAAVFENDKVNYVLLTGGMLQVPSVVQGLRRALRSPRHALVQAALREGPSLTVLDSSSVGNGVAADELFSVGGCLHSYQLACLAGAKSRIAARLAELLRKKRHTVAARIEAETLRQQQSALATAWGAMTELSGSDEDDEDNDEDGGTGTKGAAATAAHVQTPGYAFLLKRNVYLLAGNDASTVLSDASLLTSESVTLPTSSLAPLFVKGCALPARVACPLPPVSTDTAVDDVVLYLFADDGAQTMNKSCSESNSAGAAISVWPLTDGGLRVAPAATPATSEGTAAAAFAVFTLQSVTVEGTPTVSLSVHRVVSSSKKDGFPESLNPANATRVTEVVLS